MVIDVSTDLHTLNGGTYFAQGTVSKSDNWPYDGWFMGFIVVFRNGPDEYSHGGISIFYEQTSTIYHQGHAFNVWGPWVKISTATPPQEYDLPLADGISTYGKSTYWKTQDGICFINIALYSTQPITTEFVVATLPAGFRPSVKVFAGGNGFSGIDTNVRVGIDVEVNPNGSILIWTETPLENVSGFIGFIADS